MEGEDIYNPNVRNLENFELQDGVPNVQFSNLSIEFEVCSSGNPVAFADHNGFHTEFGHEMDSIARIEQLLEQGQYFVHMLYTFRSVSRAIPMITDSNAVNKDEMNRTTFHLLRPEMLKLKELMEFQKHAINVFCADVQKLAMPEARAKVVPEGLYNALIKVVDLLQKLDNLKDMKACLNNDFSRYKRAFASMQWDNSNGGITEELHQQRLTIQEEVQELQMFLGNPQHPKQLIFYNLRDAIKRIQGHEEILMEMLQQCSDLLESDEYLLPDEKYKLIRAMPHIMLLLDRDGDDNVAFNVFKQKKGVKMQTLQKLFKQYPVVPEYGDMAITLTYILQRAPHYDKDTMGSQWGDDPDARVQQRYDIQTHWVDMRAKYNEYIASFANLTNEVNAFRFRKTLDTCRYAAGVARTVLEGFKLLSEWTCRLLEMSAWKFTHPCPMSKLEQLGAKLGNPGIDYERVIRYNFSKPELSKLVDCISMIKSLASVMHRAESKLAPFLRIHVHRCIQQLVQGDLIPVLHRVDKRKKSAVMTSLLQIRTLAADWTNGIESRDDYKNYRKASGHIEATHPPRVVGPSHTQLHLLRTMIRAIYDERSDARQRSGFFSRQDLEREDVTILEEFYHTSFYFPYLLNYSGTLRNVSDLGDLWYREFYLELTMCVQFPIEMSLPWILTEHVILNQGSDVPMVENILYTMDVYNDAAHRALYVLNQQFLYDEIEAEVNLVFDQLIFLISDEMYSYFKNYAASSLLDKKYKDKLEAMRRVNFLTTSKRRYEIPMSQRHIQLLGRSVDLNYLIGQHTNNKFYKDIEAAIKKFESSDITGIYELDSLLQILRRTHELLDQYLDLDSFDSLFAEVNESFAPTSFRGRVPLHVLRTFVTDLFPNYAYNMYTQRFVRSPVQLKPTQFDAAPKNLPGNLLYGSLCAKPAEYVARLTRGFFGKPHLEALLRILGYSELPTIIEEVLKNLEDKLVEVHAYVDALREGVPPCKLPKFLFRTGGCYGFFEGKLRHILEFEDLKPEVFQNFREIGNTIALLKDLSEVMDISDTFQFMNVAPFLGLSPEAVDAPADALETPLGAALLAFGATVLKVPTMVKTQSVLNDVPHMAQRVVDICGKAFMTNSLLRYALQRIDNHLDTTNIRTSWAGIPPANGVIEVEAASEFYRLWSALNFLFCVQEEAAPTSGGENPRLVSDDEEFGHGFPLCGCLFVHLMSQRGHFDLLDFSYHVLNVNAHEQSTTKSSNQVGAVDQALQRQTDAFCAVAKEQRLIHHEIFALYEAVYSKQPTLQRGRLYSQITLFHPPQNDDNMTAAPLSMISTQRLQSSDAKLSPRVLQSPSVGGGAPPSFSAPRMPPTPVSAQEAKLETPTHRAVAAPPLPPPSPTSAPPMPPPPAAAPPVPPPTAVSSPKAPAAAFAPPLPPVPTMPPGPPSISVAPPVRPPAAASPPVPPPVSAAPPVPPLVSAAPPLPPPIHAPPPGPPPVSAAPPVPPPATAAPSGLPVGLPPSVPPPAGSPGPLPPRPPSGPPSASQPVLAPIPAPAPIAAPAAPRPPPPSPSYGPPPPSIPAAVGAPPVPPPSSPSTAPPLPRPPSPVVAPPVPSPPSGGARPPPPSPVSTDAPPVPPPVSARPPPPSPVPPAAPPSPVSTHAPIVPPPVSARPPPPSPMTPAAPARPPSPVPSPPAAGVAPPPRPPPSPTGGAPPPPPSPAARPPPPSPSTGGSPPPPPPRK